MEAPSYFIDWMLAEDKNRGPITKSVRRLNAVFPFSRKKNRCFDVLTFRTPLSTRVGYKLRSALNLTFPGEKLISTAHSKNGT